MNDSISFRTSFMTRLCMDWLIKFRSLAVIGHQVQAKHTHDVQKQSKHNVLDRANMEAQIRKRERLMKTLLSKRLAENFWRSFKWCVLTALTKNRPRFLGLTWVRHSSLSRPRRFLIFAADFSSSLAVILLNLAVWPSSSGDDVKRAAGQPGKRNYRIHRTRCDQPPLFLFALFISIL